MLLIGSVGAVSAQEQGQPTEKTPTELNGRLTEAEKQELLAKRNLLTSLDKKEAWIRSNPEEMKIAQENGWFEKAAKTRAEVRKRIKELESK